MGKLIKACGCVFVDCAQQSMCMQHVEELHGERDQWHGGCLTERKISEQYRLDRDKVVRERDEARMEMQRAGARAAVLWSFLQWVRTRNWTLDRLDKRAQELHDEGAYEIGERIVRERDEARAALESVDVELSELIEALLSEVDEQTEQLRLGAIREKRMQELRSHLETCAICPQDSKGSCHEYNELAAAIDGQTEAAHDPPPPTRLCTNFSPPWFTGRWTDWHRGHGCDRDDGKPRTPEGDAEIKRGGGQ
jgi:hypothetical protein